MSSNTLSQNPIFSPTQISGCQLWLDGADPNGTGNVPANGTSLASWVDKSGAGRTATQSTSGYQPILQTNVLAGNSCVYFDGTSVLDLVSYSTNTIPAISMFFVGRQTVFGGTFISITGSTGIYARASGGTYRYDYGGSLYVYTPNPTNSDTTSFHIQTLLLPNNAVGNYYFDGTPGDNTNGFSFDSSSFQSPNPSLGAYGRTSGNDAMTGYIAEVIFYHATLTLAESQQVEGYLAWKWGLVGNLPSNHPYKNTPIYTTTSLPPSFRNIGTVPLAPSSSPFTFFTPASITSMATWLDATDISTLYSDSNGTTLISSNGSSVRYWRDKSTNANNMRVSTAPNPPTYETGSFNAQPTLLFSNAYFNAVTLGKVSAQNASIFAFYKSNLGSGTQAPIVYGNIIGLSIEVGMYPNYYFHRHNNNNDNGVVITDTYQPLVGEILYSDSSLQYYNNFNNISPSSPVLGTPGNVFYTGFFNVGTYGNGVGYNPQFYIGEVIIYNKLVSTTERQQIEGYLAWKWGLVSNLPSNHPFKNAAPGLPVPSVPPRLTMNTRVFSPLSFAGCTLWLDATDASTLSLSGSSVTQWRDKVNAIAMTTQGTTANATVLPTGINGQQSIYLNNSVSDSVYMSGTLSSLLTGTVFYAFKALAQRITDFKPFATWFLAPGGGQFPAYGYLGGGVATNTIGPYTTFASPNGTPTQVATAGSNFIVSYGWSGTTTYVTTNGSSLQTGSQPAYSSSSTTFWIGADGVGAEGRTTLQYGEMIFYNSVLSTSQRQQIEGYLAWKWGMVGSLPANHPWKRWPPPPS